MFITHIQIITSIPLFLSTIENGSKNYSKTAFKFQTHTISNKLFSYTKLNPTTVIFFDIHRIFYGKQIHNLAYRVVYKGIKAFLTYIVIKICAHNHLVKKLINREMSRITNGNNCLIDNNNIVKFNTILFSI